MAEIKDPTTAITDKRFQEPLAVLRSGREKEATKAQELVKAEGAVEQKKQRVAELESGLQTAAAEKEAGAVRGAREAYQEKLEKEPLPEFVPTQDSVQNIAALFSLIGVMGMVAGKGDAMRAMHAMNGMLEGHQKGRADLYKQEKATFEKNFNSMVKKHEEFRKEMEDAVKTAATDRELGYQKAREAAVKAGSNVVKAMIEKFGVAKAYDSLVADNKSVEEAYKIYRQEKQAAEQRATALEAARIRASGKEGGALPKDKETRNEHRFRFSAIQNVREVLEDLKKPEVRRLIGPQNQFTPDVILNLQTGFPELAQKLARFQSEEFKIGGKSLTASEQKILGPIYNWRGLTPDALEANLKEAERTMGKEQQYLEGQFPGLREIDYAGGAAPTEAKKPMPTGDKLKAYAETHFNGDENKARKYLKTQGYE